MHFPILFSVWKSKYAEYIYLWLTCRAPAFGIHLDYHFFQEDYLMFLFCMFLELTNLSLKVKKNPTQYTKKEGIFL